MNKVPGSDLVKMDKFLSAIALHDPHPRVVLVLDHLDAVGSSKSRKENRTGNRLKLRPPEPSHIAF